MGTGCLTVGSLFSGIGGFDLGLERAGMSVLWQCEIDKHCQGVLARHFPQTHKYDDVSTLRPVGDGMGVDLICGGFPCQDLSVAGRRAGLAGSRSGLFYQFARIIEEARPTWVLIENVPGLLSSKGGRDMGAVLGTLAELGYGYAYRVLDAQHFGVPQRRRRVFIVGHSGGLSDGPRAVLFEPESGGGNSTKSREAGTEPAATTVVSTLQGGGKRGYRLDAEAAAGGHLIYNSYRTSLGKGNGYIEGFKPDRIHDALTANPPPKGPPVVVSPLLAQSNTTGGHRPPGSTVDTADQTVVVTHAFYPHSGLDQKPQENISPPLTIGSGSGANAIGAQIGTAVRRLTPKEAERLQGFPDDWTKNQSDAQRYRQLGNAVCVPVVEWIGCRIMEVA